MLSRVHLLAAPILALAMTLPAVASPTGTAVHRLRVDAAGGVALADIVSVVLSELESEVRLTKASLGGSLPVTGTEGQITVAVATIALAPIGIVLSVEGQELVVRIDRARLADQVDALEAVIRDAFGMGPNQYSLDQVPTSTPGGPPVVLIHGLDSRPEAMAGAAEVLSKAGYEVFAFRYPNDGRIRDTARHLGMLVRALHTSSGRKVSLVSVSMGGVIARAYLELEADYAGEVDRFIACAPPFAGAPLARYHIVMETIETLQDVFGDGFPGLFLFDGLGQAATDLLPGSALMRELSRTKRRPGVRYSILAGDAPIVPPEVFAAADALLARWRKDASAGDREGLDLVAEAVAEAKRVSGGTGDGAVPLKSQTLAGVTDRAVLPIHHLAFLGAKGDDGTIPALAEVMARLPRP